MNKLASEINVRVKMWQEGGASSSYHELILGEEFSYEILHNFNFHNKFGALKYKVEVVGSGNAFFSFRYEPII